VAHQLLTAKRLELEEHLDKFHSRIRISESSDYDQLQEEMKILREEYAKNERSLANKLNHSKRDVVNILLNAYREIERVIRQAQEEITASSEQIEEEGFTENKLLLAEYEMDFSMQAIDRALIVSLDAIATELASMEESKL